jgi:hypothetical protein
MDPMTTALRPPQELLEDLHVIHTSTLDSKTVTLAVFMKKPSTVTNSIHWAHSRQTRSDKCCTHSQPQLAPEKCNSQKQQVLKSTLLTQKLDTFCNNLRSNIHLTESTQHAKEHLHMTDIISLTKWLTTPHRETKNFRLPHYPQLLSKRNESQKS